MRHRQREPVHVGDTSRASHDPTLGGARRCDTSWTGCEYGIAPHRYLTGRRLDRARHALLAGARAADVAVDVGFHDQAHLTRHFKRLLGVSPGAYAASG